jgi:hypothetical protein
VAAAAFSVLVGGVAGDVEAKKSKKIFRPVVNGKRFKPRPSSIGLIGGGGTIGFLATGTKVGGTAKTVLVACAVVLDIQAFPFTSTDCTASYTETKVRPFSIKIWQPPAENAIGMIEVTIDEYTPGVFVSGRFRALQPLPSSQPLGLPPITLEGEFRGKVELDDGSN